MTHGHDCPKKVQMARLLVATRCQTWGPCLGALHEKQTCFGVLELYCCGMGVKNNADRFVFDADIGRPTGKKRHQGDQPRYPNVAN